LIAHTLISFGFADGRFLTFSIEIRKEKGESFSAIGGFFKHFEMSLVAADERDILRVRTNARRGHASVPRDDAQGGHALAVPRLPDEAESLKRQPQFYNTLTANCTTIVFEMVRRIVRRACRRLPPARVRLPDRYLYDVKGLVPAWPSSSCATVGTSRAPRARAANDDADFCIAIRAAACRAMTKRANPQLHCPNNDLLSQRRPIKP
jgi:hypothetical protein